MSKTTEQFIKEAQSLWGDKYNYSKVVYAMIEQKYTLKTDKYLIL